MPAATLVAPASGSRLDVCGNQTIQRIEEQLCELESHASPRLLLPLDPNCRRLGGEAALMQLLITWGRQQSGGGLETYLSASAQGASPEAERLQRLAERPFGFVALCMARDVTDKDATEGTWTSVARGAVTDYLANFRKPRMNASGQTSLWGEDDCDWSEDNWPRRGRQLFFPVVDHHKFWRLPEFYFPSDNVRDREDFVAFAGRVLKRLNDNRVDVDRYRRAAPFSPDLTKNLGLILHELIKNTHQWARHDVHGATLPRSVRGALFQLHTDSRERLMSLVEGMPALDAYIRGLPDNRSVRLLEISLFDSGPGLAARWLSSTAEWRDDLDCATEVMACLACLEKGKTSSSQLDRGIGLHEVVTTLSELRGFLRLRTGRLSLYRDFVETPIEFRDSAGQHVLHDWTSRTTDLNPMARVEGTLYTMLLPI